MPERPFIFQDVDGCIQAIVSLLFTLSDDVDTAEVMKSIRSAITSSNESPRNRLRALTSLFNLAMSSQSKYEILTGMLSFKKKQMKINSDSRSLQPFSDSQ